ncbi:hypothetical protein [Streptomyces sp. NPDC058677]|uniref:hypothetical protein n=1 Tax=Streptomyces sp. NPDC058677 TaxID=3346594 RepID=UPI003646FCB5
MVDPIPPYLSPERLKHLQQLADASLLRAALYPSLKPPPGPAPLAAIPRWPKPNPWRSARLRRPHQR